MCFWDQQLYSRGGVKGKDGAGICDAVRELSRWESPSEVLRQEVKLSMMIDGGYLQRGI